MANWVRLWEDMPTDPKWRVIARRAGRPISEVLAVFVFMMTNAGASGSGALSGWDDEDVAAALDIEPQAVESIRNAMQGKTLDGENLTGWDKRQPKREDNSYERTKAWRERKNGVTQCDAVKRSVTQCDAPDTDTDTDKIISPNGENTREPSARDILLECLSEKSVSDLIAHRQAKRARLTPRAARELAKAFRAYGDPEAAVSEMILRGWTAFKPEWMRQEPRAGPSQKPANTGIAARELLRLKQEIYGDSANQSQTSASFEALEFLPVERQS